MSTARVLGLKTLRKELYFFLSMDCTKAARMIFSSKHPPGTLSWVIIVTLNAESKTSHTSHSSLKYLKRSYRLIFCLLQYSVLCGTQKQNLFLLKRNMSVFWVGGGHTAYHYKDSYINIYKKDLKKKVFVTTLQKDLYWAKWLALLKHFRIKLLGRGELFLKKICVKNKIRKTSIPGVFWGVMCHLNFSGLFTLYKYI